MTLIKASCPGCGEVELTPADVALMVCSHAPLSYYAFTCNGCGDEVRKPADDHVVSLLVSGGVPATVWEHMDFAVERGDGVTNPFDNVKVRQAVAYAVNRQEIIDTAMLGEGQVTGPLTIPAYKSDPSTLFCYQQDVEKAKELMAAAGMSDGFTAKVIAATGEDLR